MPFGFIVVLNRVKQRPKAVRRKCPQLCVKIRARHPHMVQPRNRGRALLQRPTHPLCNLQHKPKRGEDIKIPFSPTKHTGVKKAAAPRGRLQLQPARLTMGQCTVDIRCCQRNMGKARVISAGCSCRGGSRITGKQLYCTVPII